VASLALVRERVTRTHRDDDGSAMVEFVALTLLLLVPLVYLVLTLARIQAGIFAAESASSAAARVSVVHGVARLESGAPRVQAMEWAAQYAHESVTQAVSDFGFEATDATLAITCEAQCLEPGSNITTTVTIDVKLPGIPGFLAEHVPMQVQVQGHSRAPVDSMARDL